MELSLVVKVEKSTQTGVPHEYRTLHADRGLPANHDAMPLLTDIPLV